ncbi:MAG TPA: hypothetical protein GX745_06545 [Clostridiales bacterium]|jgi:ferredoxin|nr:hypothetical protein [Clostridiales bacterium]
MSAQIYYFSGTGNCLFVAKNLASYLDGQYINISKRVKEKEIVLQSDTIGFVFPVYAYTYPKILNDFYKKIKIISNPKYVFIITTYGSTPGRSAEKFSKKLKNLFAVNYINGILMPENYIAIFKLDNDSAIRQKINDALLTIEKISADIKNQVQYLEKHNSPLDYIKTGLVSPLFNFFLLFSHIFFSADKNCNGCDICVRVCPTNNIEKINNKPKWRNNCIQCMACINWCPQKSINYTPMTKKRPRYTNPHIDLKELYKE